MPATGASLAELAMAASCSPEELVELYDTPGLSEETRAAVGRALISRMADALPAVEQDISKVGYALYCVLYGKAGGSQAQADRLLPSVVSLCFGILFTHWRHPYARWLFDDLAGYFAKADFSRETLCRVASEALNDPAPSEERSVRRFGLACLLIQRSIPDKDRLGESVVETWQRYLQGQGANRSGLDKVLKRLGEADIASLEDLEHWLESNYQDLALKVVGYY